MQDGGSFSDGRAVCSNPNRTERIITQRMVMYGRRCGLRPLGRLAIRMFATPMFYRVKAAVSVYHRPTFFLIFFQ
jgi:hypothetical protein